MEIVGAFQTPIMVSTIELPEINHLHWVRKQLFQQTSPNIQEDKLLDNFCKNICNTATKLAINLGYKNTEFFITQMWANKYKALEGIHTHHHANSFFSGVIYFDDVGSTVFLRDSNVKNILQLPLQEDTSFNNNMYEVPSAKGRIVIFPSYMVHYSTNNTNLDRTTISFNLLPKQLGDYNEYNFVEIRQ